jgi:hypothetical protein
MFELMSTRYSNYGINTVSDVEIFKGNVNIKNPKMTIYHLRLDFNTTSSAWETMTFFRKNVFDTINRPFVFIITGEDITFPNQVDIRWQEPYQIELVKGIYNDVLHHPLLIHFFIENRDEIHEKTSSIPLGLNPREMPNCNIDYIQKFMNNFKQIENRPLKVISLHRKRPGDRVIIDNFNNSDWKDFVISSGNYEKDSWWELLQSFPFIICAHGGGIDPCPKVWEALCVGCIPIIKSSAMNDVYSEFPIVIVDSWNSNTISYYNLIKWRERFSKYYDNPNLKNEWIHKLYLNYWKDKIEFKIKT